MLLTTAVSAQVSLVQPAYPSTAQQRTEVRSPVSGIETLGDGECEVKISGYEATATQLIVKIAKQPRSCRFADLKFLLNGRAYDLAGLDGNFVLQTPSQNYEWIEDAQPNSWIWFQIGSRLPVDALVRAQGSLGVYEYNCKPNQNCLTSSRIDVAAAEPLVAAANAYKLRDQAAANVVNEARNNAQTTNDTREKLNLDSITEVRQPTGSVPFMVSQGKGFVNLISFTIHEFKSQDTYFQGTAIAFRKLLENYVIRTSKPLICFTLPPAQTYGRQMPYAMCLKSADVANLQRARTLSFDERSIPAKGPFFRSLLGSAQLREFESSSILNAPDMDLSSKFTSQISGMYLGIADILALCRLVWNLTSKASMDEHTRLRHRRL